MQSKEPYRIMRQPLKTSISYMLNNLTSSDKYIAYANTSDPQQILIYPIRAELEFQLGLEVNIKLPIDEQITDIKYLNFSSGWKLVIATMKGYYIFKDDGSKQLSQFKKILGQQNLAQDNKEIVPQYFFMGITMIKTQDNQEVLCVGATSSEVYFSVAQQDFFEEPFLGIEFTKKKNQITCLASSIDDCVLAIADQIGQIQLFMTINVKEMGYIKELTTNSNSAPVITMQVMNRKKHKPNLNNILVCGDFIGRIMLYDLTEYTQLALINAHIKLITSLDCDGEQGEIISGSEDTYLNFWKIEQDQDVNIKVSYRLADQLIVGVQYVKTEKSPIIVSCLESQELTFLYSNN